MFIIRFAERRIDQLLDSCILDYAPQGSESETVQFESEWSFLRPFVKKKAPSSLSLGTPPGHRNNLLSVDPVTPRPSTGTRTHPSPSAMKFSPLKQTIARAHAISTGTPIKPAFSESSAKASPYELTSFLTALQTLLVFADINPLFTTQLWSQVFYWTSCTYFSDVESNSITTSCRRNLQPCHHSEEISLSVRRTQYRQQLPAHYSHFPSLGQGQSR